MVHVVKNKARRWLSSSSAPLAFRRGFEGDLIIQRDCPVLRERRISFAVGPGQARTRFSASLHPRSRGPGVPGAPGLLQGPSTRHLLPPRLLRRWRNGGSGSLRLVQRVRRLRSCLALLPIRLLIFRGYRGDVIDDDDDDNGNRGDRWQINS